MTESLQLGQLGCWFHSLKHTWSSVAIELPTKTMEKAFVVKGKKTSFHHSLNSNQIMFTSMTFFPLDMNSFECLSPSELDKNFLGEQSLLSALSLEQLSPSNYMGADGSDTKVSSPTSLYISSDPSSPSVVFSLNTLNIPETDSCHLPVPFQGKSSTPHMLIQNQKKAECDQSYGELTASQMSWDVSLIHSESNNPKVYMDSSALNSEWIPKSKSTQQSLAEVSPWPDPTLKLHTGMKIVESCLKMLRGKQKVRCSIVANLIHCVLTVC